ncbi:alpha/beta hydrolase family protein [Nonomuraea sp. NPDC050790]|uniref:alpha/beta hydrolase family protein n=1 Tax=Nonomuraea sp. NPDC050790 TaxID=3364371 RepID=UPI00379A6B10
MYRVVLGGLLAITSLIPAPAEAATSALVAGKPVVANQPPRVLGAAAPRGLGAAGTSRPAKAPYLPKPTGSRPVGAVQLHLKDTSRPDPWVPSVKMRELMVTVWYPAKAPGRRRAPYMTAKESELLLKDGEVTGVPPGILATTRTHAFTDARPHGKRRSLPLVVLSPGFKKPRATLTALAEDLASRGYVVAGIDHTYESVATAFPGGRVTTCVPCEGPQTPATSTKAAKGRAADVAFVIDRLTGERAAWKGAGLVDRGRIAMAGHSLGGASSLAAMVKDVRIRAGIDIDGTVPDGVLDSDLGRPFMFLGKPSTYTPGSGDPAAATWEAAWKRLTGWKRWLLMTGAAHETFNDLGPLAQQLGLGAGSQVPGPRAWELTRLYVGAFLDLHLRNKPRPMLDRPSHPEIVHGRM